MDGWRTACSGFGAAVRSVSQLKKRAKELGVEVPSHAEKHELVDLVEQAENNQRLGGSGGISPMPRSVGELKARLRELGYEVPTTICEKRELIELVTEAEKQHAKLGGRSPHTQSQKPATSPAKPSPVSPVSPVSPTKVRYRNSAGNIPPPWYQMESRSRPGNFYYVNADTGERTWDMPKAGPAGIPAPPPRAQAYRHVPADFVPAAPAGQWSSSLPFSPPANGLRGAYGAAVPPGMPPLTAFVSSPQPRGMPPLPTDAGLGAALQAGAGGTAVPEPPVAAAAAAQPAVESSALPELPMLDEGTGLPGDEESDVFGQTNPLAEALKDAVGGLAVEDGSATLQTTAGSEGASDELLDASARHDYRDQGFRNRGPPIAPPDEKRWSRHGAMHCQRAPGDTGGVKALSFTIAEEPWDPETTVVESGAVRGKEFTWIRGKMLGRGSLGRVFKALDCKTGKTIAVKEVPIDLHSEHDRQYLADLQNEVSIMQELKHQNIVGYLGHDFMDNSLYMYIEHMPGGSLTQALQQFGPFDETLLAEYAKQIICGLEYMHSRDPPVVHRDIKGPNILVSGECRVKLADFGCAKRTQETMTHTMRGSIHWMAPEVIAHERYGRAADIWSFGCVCIEMGTATVPWGKLDNQMAAVIKIGMSEETPPLPEGLSATGQNFIAICVQRDASLRPTASGLLSHPLVDNLMLPGCPADED